MRRKVTISLLATGVPGLDSILGGGLPEFSFNLIAGPPGSGKTTLAHQIMFALATPERRALFFTVLGEPPWKMLRYQQQFSFFDPGKINQSIKFVNLSHDVTTGHFDQVLARIMEEVKAFSPGLVFVDSFRSLMLEASHQANSTMSPLQFMQELGIKLSGWQATAFLIGEYASDNDAQPVSSVADGLLSLNQCFTVFCHLLSNTIYYFIILFIAIYSLCHLTCLHDDTRSLTLYCEQARSLYARKLA